VIAGFAGVMIALGPTAGSLTPAAMVAIAGSFSFSILMVCTRLVRGTSDIVLVTTQTVGALLFGAIAAPFTWVALTPGDTALLVLLGVVAMIAHVCINRALKLAPACRISIRLFSGRSSWVLFSSEIFRARRC
jgi:hypothetical protein